MYTPLQGNGLFPVIVYYHGGGWVIADLDTYEPSARALAEKTGAVVVSVAYRQAPETSSPQRMRTRSLRTAGLWKTLAASMGTRTVLQSLGRVRAAILR